MIHTAGIDASTQWKRLAVKAPAMLTIWSLLKSHQGTIHKAEIQGTAPAWGLFRPTLHRTEGRGLLSVCQFLCGIRDHFHIQFHFGVDRMDDTGMDNSDAIGVVEEPEDLWSAGLHQQIPEEGHKQ